MDDGVSLAATLFKPDGTPPGGGWPAIVMFHGLGQTRASSNTIAKAAFAPEGYAVLTFDARGQGASGGLFSADGPREMQDVRNLLTWLDTQSGIGAAHPGAYGVSLGGGAVWRSTVEGVPWGAIVPVITWTDLYQALIPQDLSKSGAVYQFLQSAPPERSTDELNAIRTDAIQSTNLPALHSFAAARSSLPSLNEVHAPVFMLQGRRDFAFDISQASQAFSRLKVAKRLYIGDLGHSPAANPAAEQPHYLDEARMWFDRWLKGTPNGIDTRPKVELAPDPWTGKTFQYKGLPSHKTLSFALAGKAAIGPSGKVVRTSARLAKKIETFGAATLTISTSKAQDWLHLVAVLTAVTPKGKEIVVSEGGASTKALTGTARSVTIHLIDDATPIPAGSKLKVTLAASSTAQNPGNLLYLDIGMPASARLTIGKVILKLPGLKNPISA